MGTILNTAGQIPEVIRDLVNLILQGTAEDFIGLFQNSMDDLVQQSNKCGTVAKETEDAFKNMAGLAQVSFVRV